MGYVNATRKYFDGYHSRYWVWVDGRAFMAPTLESAIALATTRYKAVIEDGHSGDTITYVNGEGVTPTD